MWHPYLCKQEKNMIVQEAWNAINHYGHPETFWRQYGDVQGEIFNEISNFLCGPTYPTPNLSEREFLRVKNYYIAFKNHAVFILYLRSQSGYENPDTVLKLYNFLLNTDSDVKNYVTRWRAELIRFLDYYKEKYIERYSHD
jgi:hypothetical protein